VKEQLPRSVKRALHLPWAMAVPVSRTTLRRRTARRVLVCIAIVVAILGVVTACPDSVRPGPRLDCGHGSSWGGIADYAADAAGEATPVQVAKRWAAERPGNPRYVRYRVFGEWNPMAQRTIAWYDADGDLTEVHRLVPAPRGGWVIEGMAGCG
jgi:hypothetical protein